MKKNKCIYIFLILVFIKLNFNFILFASVEETLKSSIYDSTIKWKQISKGIEYTKYTCPKKSIFGNNKIDIIKINPSFFNFYLISSTENKVLNNADFWIKKNKYNLIFNAGMFKLNDELIHKFYMRNYKSINNPILNYNANGIIAFNPKFDNSPSFKIFDLKKENWSHIDSSYNTLIQGLRMIDSDGFPIYWKSQDQKCSMLIVSMDKCGNLYVIFSRSPYTQNSMTDILDKMPIELVDAIYLEGGSRANFVLNCNGFKIKRVGSYVSGYNENDDNDKFYPFPNFICLKYKKSTN